jgi:ketosteroid isomerase-like protein
MTVFMLFACAQPLAPETLKTEKSTVVNVDSLNTLFVEGWNQKDSAAIMNIIASDAIVMNDSLIHTGHSAIASGWVSGGVKVLSNIVTNPLNTGFDENIAFDAGTYSLDLTIPGGPLLKERGNYSLIWKKQSDQQWKLAHIHIEDITRMPDVPR